MTADDPIAQGSMDETAPVLKGDDGPVFREAWEAQAFALTRSLCERGVFSWPEWTAALARAILRAQAAGDPDTGETYEPVAKLFGTPLITPLKSRQCI